MSYAKALEKSQCESVETTIPKRRPLFGGGLQRMADERLTRRVMYGARAGGGNPGLGLPENNWVQRPGDNLRRFQETPRGPRKPLLCSSG